MTSADEWAAIARVTRTLAPRFAGTFSGPTVERFVAERFEQLGSVRTERFAGERLSALARAKGAVVSDTPEVLFVCVQNAGRSQMAAALLDHHARGRVHVRSAGSAPAAEVHPEVTEVMAELGLDLSKELPKPLTDEVARVADVIVTMGCGDACPVHPGKRYLDWELADPAGKTLDDVRAIRDDIEARVRELLVELVGDEEA